MSSLCFWHVEHPEFLPLGLEHQIYFGRNQIVSEISFSNQFLETLPNGEYPVPWLLEQHFSNRTFLENLPFSSMIYMIYRWWVSSSVTKKQAYKPSGLSPRTDSNYELPYNAQVKRRLDRMIPSTNSKISNVSNDDSNVSSVRNHVASTIWQPVSPTTNHIGPGWSIAKPVASSGKILGMGTWIPGYFYVFL